MTIRCKCSFSRDCTVLVPVALTPEITVADLARDFLDRAKKKYPHVFDQFPIEGKGDDDTPVFGIGLIDSLLLPEEVSDEDDTFAVDISVNASDRLECFITPTPTRRTHIVRVTFVPHAAAIIASCIQSDDGATPRSDVSRSLDTTPQSGRKLFHETATPSRGLNSHIVRQENPVQGSVFDFGENQSFDNDGGADLAPTALAFVPRPPAGGDGAKRSTSASRPAGRRYIGASSVVARVPSEASRSTSRSSRSPDAEPPMGSNDSQPRVVSLSSTARGSLSPFSPNRADGGHPTPGRQGFVQASNTREPLSDDALDSEVEELRSKHKAIRFAICTEERKARKSLNSLLDSIKATSPVKRPLQPLVREVNVESVSASAPTTTTDDPEILQHNRLEINAMLHAETSARSEICELEAATVYRIADDFYLDAKRCQLRAEKQWIDSMKKVIADESSSRMNVEDQATKKLVMFQRLCESGVRRILGHSS